MTDRNASQARRFRRGLPLVLAAAAGVAAASAAPAFRDQDPIRVEETRAVLDRWVEARRLISQERSDWELSRVILQDRVALLEREIESVRARIAEAETSITEADRKRAELLEQGERLRSDSALFVERVATLQAQALELLRRLPETLQERVRPFSQRLPPPGAATELTAGQRFQFLIAVLNEVDKFHRDLTVATEVRVLGDGRSAEVTVVYLGISQAFYATADGSAAGVGTASSEGWEWISADEAAPAIVRVIAILKNEAVADFVPVPVRIH